MKNIQKFTFRIICLFALCTLVIGSVAVKSTHAGGNLDVGSGGNIVITTSEPAGKVVLSGDGAGGTQVLATANGGIAEVLALEAAGDAQVAALGDNKEARLLTTGVNSDAVVVATGAGGEARVVAIGGGDAQLISTQGDVKVEAQGTGNMKLKAFDIELDSGQNIDIFADDEIALNANGHVELISDTDDVEIAAEGGIGSDVTINSLNSAVDITAATTASMTVPSAGGTNGIVVGTSSTTIMGGTGTTQMVVDDDGVKFSSVDDGSPVKVTGVADGVDPYDAVNKRQLNRTNARITALDDKVDDVATNAYSGIASVAALAAIPEPGPGKKVAIGVGYGNYLGEHAVAGGVKAHIGEYVNLTAGAGYSNTDFTTQAGVGFNLW